MLFPSKSQQLRGNKTKTSRATLKGKSREENGRLHRAPLTEIDDTSFEFPLHSNQNHLHTHSSYAPYDKLQNPSQQQVIEPLGSVDTLSCSCVTVEHENFTCKTNSKTVENRAPILAENVQEKECCLKMKGRKEGGRNRRRAEQKNGAVVGEKGMERMRKGIIAADEGSGSHDQRSIHNLSVLVDATCISTTVTNSRIQPTFVGSGAGSSVIVGKTERGHTQMPHGHRDQPHPFDVSTFCLPTSSTPCGARRVHVLDGKEEGSNECNKSSCSASEMHRKMDIVKQTQTPSITTVPQIWLCEREEKEDKIQCKDKFIRGSLEEHSSTTVMFKPNLSTPSNTAKIHSSICDVSNFSGASILAPETPPELWGVELVGAGRPSRTQRTLPHSGRKCIVSIEDSFFL